MWEPTTDELRRAASGDARVLESIVGAYHPSVYRYLVRLVGDASDAEDLTQETFLRMARGLAGFEGRCSLSTWVFRIARHAGLDLIRRRQSLAPTSSLDAVSEAGGAGGIEGFEEADLLRWCISHLNSELRSALVLRDVLGFSYQEIADILDTSLATVRWRIYEAREQVQVLYRTASGSDLRPRSLGGRLVDGRLA
jgi:RNA polymerase sigma-70 factor, ECF subfamily